jgi:hypothetical protein
MELTNASTVSVEANRRYLFSLYMTNHIWCIAMNCYSYHAMALNFSNDLLCIKLCLSVQSFLTFVFFGYFFYQKFTLCSLMFFLCCSFICSITWSQSIFHAVFDLFFVYSMQIVTGNLYFVQRDEPVHLWFMYRFFAKMQLWSMSSLEKHYCKRWNSMVEYESLKSGLPKGPQFWPVDS